MPSPQSIDAPYPAARYAWYVTVVLTLCYAVASIDRLILGVLTPAIQADLHLTDTQAGLIQGLAFFMFYTLFGLPIGWLVDRSHRKRILTAGIVAWSGMTLVCGLATGFVSLFLARVGVGVGEATLNPSATSILGDYFPDSGRSKAFGLYGAGSGLGAIMSFTGGGLLYRWLQSHPHFVLPILGEMAPWQMMFILMGAPGLIVAPLLYFTVREPLRRKRISTVAPRASDLIRFLALNKYTILTHHLGIALLMMPIYAMFTWLPTFFLRVHGWPPASFGVAFGIPAGLLGTAGSISAGFFAAWLKSRGDKLGTMRACVIGGALCVAGHIAAPLMPTAQLSFITVLLSGIFSTYSIVLGYTAIAEVVPNELRARVTATFILCTGLISATLGPLLVGMISQALPGNPHGIAVGMVVVGAALGAPGVILLALGLKPYRRSLERAATFGAH